MNIVDYDEKLGMGVFDGFVVTTDDGRSVIFEGFWYPEEEKPFVADLNNDGHYEIYINIMEGSGFMHSLIAGYDFQNDCFFTLSERFKYDYECLVVDNQLYVIKYLPFVGRPEEAEGEYYLPSLDYKHHTLILTKTKNPLLDQQRATTEDGRSVTFHHNYWFYITETFEADLNNDGYTEVYINAMTSSQHTTCFVMGYDFVNKCYFKLNEHYSSEYRFIMVDDQLYVRKTAIYLNGFSEFYYIPRLDYKNHTFLITETAEPKK